MIIWFTMIHKPLLYGFMVINGESWLLMMVDYMVVNMVNEGPNMGIACGSDFLVAIHGDGTGGHPGRLGAGNQAVVHGVEEQGGNRCLGQL